MHLIVVKPTIVNSIHSSKESLKCSGSKVIVKPEYSLTDALEATELVSLNTDVKHTMPWDKRWR